MVDANLNPRPGQYFDLHVAFLVSVGLEGVTALFERVAAQMRSTLIRVGFVNGLPGFVTREADGELQTTALEIDGGKITAIYVVRNPDKLRHLHS